MAEHAPRGPVEIFDPCTYGERVPYDLYAELRRDRPVCWVDEPAVLGWPAGPGFWAVLRHGDVRRVLRHDESFSSWLGATQIRDPDRVEDLEFVRQMMLNMDRPAHTRLRTLVASSFTPRAVAELTHEISRHAGSMLDAVDERDEVDFVDVSADLPVATLAALMGVPMSDRRLLYDWANRIIGYQDAEYAVTATAAAEDLSPMGRAALAGRPDLTRREGERPVNPRSRSALVDMFAYAHALAGHKRDHPGNDILSILLNAEHEGGSVTAEEFENMFFLFTVAGNETLRNAIPGGMLCLLDHPDEQARLRHQPELWPRAVEEMLRYWPPVLHFRRTARVDVEVAGQPIRAGDKVVVFHGSANRDATVFSDPERFDVGRSPNEHVSFGYGAHFCLGAHLARLQVRALLGGVLERFATIELAGAPVRMVSNFQNGLKHLQVRWSKR